ncbi:gag_pre-integrs domain-containing protein [Trichonephila clavipes]|nr:gag_pre-integrs domain-containing protein [Trichonephila clavipes]
MASKHCLRVVPHKFWGEALLCFTYAWNRICHKDGNKTPFEKYSGRKPSVLHLIPFGCLAYAGVPKQIRKKFDMRAKMGIMMGYAQRTKGYRIWLIDENRLVETINVRFYENKRGINFRQKVNSNFGYNLNLPDYYDEDDFDRVKDSLTSRLVSKTSTETPSTSEKPDISSDNHSLIPCTEVKWIRNIDLSEQQALMVEVTIPNCYKQAIRSRDASKWHDAMDKEINVMMERKIQGARLVARGNTQLRGETFDEIFQELELSKVKSLKLRCYSDSDFATNRDDRVSMGGFITFIDETPISWRTFKQKSVSLSTMEAELVESFFKNDEGHNVTVNGDRYRAMITNFFIPELNNHDVQELWFQQDGAAYHTARATIDLLKDTFGDRLISRFGPVNWPPRSCDLTPLDYFLWGYVKSLVYADKPQTLDHLEDNIRRVIADIQTQMLEKVIEN